MLNDAQLKTVLQAAGFTVVAEPIVYDGTMEYALTSPPNWTGAHIPQSWQQSEAVAWRAVSYYAETTDFWFAMLDAVLGERIGWQVGFNPFTDLFSVKIIPDAVRCEAYNINLCDALAAALYAYVRERERRNREHHHALRRRLLYSLSPDDGEDSASHRRPH